MASPRQFPWPSLLLLLASYIILGRVLIEAHYSHEAWWFAGFGGLVIAILYLHPLTDLNRLLQHWFSSDTVAFCILVMLAASVSILLNWIRLFLHVALVLSAEGLARLDLQAAKYSEIQTFVMLVCTTAVGLGLAWVWGSLN
jgi:hypothetical protein